MSTVSVVYVHFKNLQSNDCLCRHVSTLSEVYMNMPVKQALIILSFCKTIPFKIKREKFMPLDVVQWVKNNDPRGLTAWKKRSNLCVSRQQLAVKQP